MANNISVLENGKKQFIVVKIGSEQYGIDISYVDNIVRMQKITRVPKVQPYFKGIINLRGEIVPVMSIRTKMDLEPDVFTDVTPEIGRAWGAWDFSGRSERSGDFRAG